MHYGTTITGTGVILKLIFTLTAFLLLTTGCDPEHKKKCEWYLMPDTSRIGQVQEGFIPVCARNLVVNREDCRLQSTLEFAKDAYNKKFIYDEMKVKNLSIPRTIEKIKFCS